MAKTADVGSGQVIASAWGNEIRDRTEQLFTTESERNSQWPATAPPVGASCITTDTGTRWQKVGSAWVPAAGSVPAFADTATRDSKWPNPPEGAMCHTTSPYRQVWVRQGGVWKGSRTFYFGRLLNRTYIHQTDCQLSIDTANSGGTNITVSSNRLILPWDGVYFASSSIFLYMPNASAGAEIWSKIRLNTGASVAYTVSIAHYMMQGQWWNGITVNSLMSCSSGQGVDFAIFVNGAAAASGGIYNDPYSTFQIQYMFGT